MGRKRAKKVGTCRERNKGMAVNRKQSPIPDSRPDIQEVILSARKLFAMVGKFGGGFQFAVRGFDVFFRSWGMATEFILFSR